MRRGAVTLMRDRGMLGLMAVLVCALPVFGQAQPAPQPPARALTGADAERVKTLYQERDRLIRLGRLADAQAVAEEVLAIHRRVLGDDHIDTARTYDALAT